MSGKILEDDKFYEGGTTMKGTATQVAPQRQAGNAKEMTKKDIQRRINEMATWVGIDRTIAKAICMRIPAKKIKKGGKCTDGDTKAFAVLTDIAKQKNAGGVLSEKTVIEELNSLKAERVLPQVVALSRADIHRKFLLTRVGKILRPLLPKELHVEDFYDNELEAFRRWFFI